MTTGYRIATPRWKRENEHGFSRDSGMLRGGGRELPVDKVMLAVVLGLTLFGVVMVYSASAVLAQKTFGSQFYFLARQGLWAALGLIAMAVAMCIDYRHYRRPVVVGALLVTTFGLLIAVFLFPAINSTHRWIRFGAISIQPSEISKLALVAFLGFLLHRRAGLLNSFQLTFLPAALVSGALVVLVALEPDLGTALALVAVFGVMMFQSGVPVRYLGALAMLALPPLVYMLLVPWRRQRIMDFLDPWENQTGSSFQIVQSL
ncbi:MAG TPA: FtsW/RodA/SpoVE family cell cycle protein, partial [Blastocatellia bacterium]|nr:FtsW/RodA/SpoVE family cell cycle protein [Blastocatellia bacterium]